MKEVRILYKNCIFISVKAGGMRIPTKHHHPPPPPAPTPEEKAENEEFAEPKERFVWVCNANK